MFIPQPLEKTSWIESFSLSVQEPLKGNKESQVQFAFLATALREVWRRDHGMAEIDTGRPVRIYCSCLQEINASEGRERRASR